MSAASTAAARRAGPGRRPHARASACGCIDAGPLTLRPERHVSDLRSPPGWAGPRGCRSDRQADPRGARPTAAGVISRRWSQIWSPERENGPPVDIWRAVLPGSGGRIRTYDLWVMRGTGTVPGGPVGPALSAVTCRSAGMRPSSSPLSPLDPIRPYYSPYYRPRSVSRPHRSRCTASPG